MALEVGSHVVTLIILLAASVVEFATTADLCTNENSGRKCTENKVAWALACGVFSTALCVLALALTRVYLSRPAIVDVVLAIVIVGIWVFGAAFNTSTTGVFADTGNGYFSTWIALLAAANYAHLSLGHLIKPLQGHITLSGPVLVLVASIVEMSTAADFYVNNSGYTQDKGRVEWAVAVGAVSTALCAVQLLLLYLHLSVADSSGKVLGLLLVAMWSAGAGVNTSSKGPFSGTGNGYFFSWVAFGASIHYAYTVFVGVRQDIYADASAPVSSGNPQEPPMIPPPAVGTGPGYQTLE